MSLVSGSLDEEDRPDVRKGYEIAVVDNRLRLSLTDGFKLNFQFSLFDPLSNLVKRKAVNHYQTSNFPEKISEIFF